MKCLCGSEMILRNSKYGKFWGCIRYPKCKETHGSHPNGEPLGILADKETRLLRIKAHDLCGKIWGDWNTISRRKKKDMYKWLKENTEMGHIAKMTKNDLLNLIEKLKEMERNLGGVGK